MSVICVDARSSLVNLMTLFVHAAEEICPPDRILRCAQDLTLKWFICGYVIWLLLLLLFQRWLSLFHYCWLPHAQERFVPRWRAPVSLELLLAGGALPPASDTRRVASGAASAGTRILADSTWPDRVQPPMTEREDFPAGGAELSTDVPRCLLRSLSAGDGIWNGWIICYSIGAIQMLSLNFTSVDLASLRLSISIGKMTVNNVWASKQAMFWVQFRFSFDGFGDEWTCSSDSAENEWCAPEHL